VKIALFGYGKMGRMIEEIALERGHEIVLRINGANRDALKKEDLEMADAVIEFTAPASAVENILLCLEAGVPVVTGTTGWYADLEKVKAAAASKNGSLVYATNFSIGVNMLFAMNKRLAKWMNAYPDYDVEIDEIHHTQKLDAPSGTAITLAEGVLENLERKSAWKEQEMNATSPAAGEDVLRIKYARTDGVPGIHKVKYTSAIDEIQISHEAFSRKGFALGAVLAAEFIKEKKGTFTAAEIFGF
jgi:4-hydroxy-tetrahydrodipicolinate reductase